MDLATLTYVADLLMRQGFPRASVLIQGEVETAKAKAEAAKIVPIKSRVPDTASIGS